MTKLLEALSKLDTTNDNHWTGDGLPRLDTVKFLMGGADVSRADVSAAAPGFSRATGSAGLPGAAQQATVPTTAPEAPATAQQPAQEPTAAPAGATPPAATQGTQEPSNGTQEVDGGAGAANSQEGAGGEGGEEGEGDPIAAADRRYHAAVKAKEEADRELAAAAKALDVLLQAQPQSRPGQAFSDALQHYRASQEKVMAERVRRMEALKGVNLRDILPTKAPIDQAFGRKTGRGRPQF